MKTEISNTIRRILEDTVREIEQDKSRESVKRLKQKMRDALPIRSFAGALSHGSALIAELKERSPSQGKMKGKNFQDATEAYRKCAAVKAISVLTSWHHFGLNMRVTMMEAVKQHTGKPVLRKDFILEEYQVYQARAYGADAILLMANILDREEMRRLSDLAFELRMDVLFETHNAPELEELPDTAKIVGINARSFEGGARSFQVSRILRRWLGSGVDRSVDLTRFQYATQVPDSMIKVAESGVSAKNCAQVFSLGFDAILVGTSLLMDERGVVAGLREFESAIGTIAPRPKRSPKRTRNPLETDPVKEDEENKKAGL